MVASTCGQAVPTPKTLRESGCMVAEASLSGCAMQVFNNGFAVYQSDGHYTVLRMEHVGTYEGFSVEDEGWSVGVMLCGEDRLEKRYQEKAENRFVPLYTKSHDGDEEELQIESGEDFTEAVATADEVHSILDCLTERQRQVVEMYYLEGLTQQQIADRLGVSHQAIDKSLRLAINKIKKR